jgi:RimJ/RimL family protein N-acetyltransferase
MGGPLSVAIKVLSAAREVAPEAMATVGQAVGTAIEGTAERALNLVDLAIGKETAESILGETAKLFRRGATIETERLMLRPTNVGDRDFYHRIYGDAANLKYMGGAKSAQDIEGTFHGSLLPFRKTELRATGVVVEKATAQPVGLASVSATGIPGESGAELGWIVSPNAQRRGYASEISRSMIDYAFGHPNINSVRAATHPANPASNQLLRRLQFRDLGVRSIAFPSTREPSPWRIWELTRDAWR